MELGSAAAQVAEETASPGPQRFKTTHCPLCPVLLITVPHLSQG